MPNKTKSSTIHRASHKSEPSSDEGFQKIVDGLQVDDLNALAIQTGAVNGTAPNFSKDASSVDSATISDLGLEWIKGLGSWQR